MSAYVLLEDGARFDGDAVGAAGTVTGEVVFTTGMSGYQEAVSDPSFHGQVIVFTYPHIGNYGVSAEGMESDRVHARAVVMREAVNADDAPGAEGGWLDWLSDCGIPAITGVDTRALVRHIREAGAMRGGIFGADVPQAEALDRIHSEPSMRGRDLAREVTVREPHVVAGQGSGPRIVALDTGIKHSIVRNFTQRGATIELLPCDTRRPSCSTAIPTASSSCPVRVTRRRSTISSTPSGSCWARSPCSASVSDTSSCRAPSGLRP